MSTYNLVIAVIRIICLYSGVAFFLLFNAGKLMVFFYSLLSATIIIIMIIIARCLGQDLLSVATGRSYFVIFIRYLLGSFVVLLAHVSTAFGAAYFIMLCPLLACPFSAMAR